MLPLPEYLRRGELVVLVAGIALLAVAALAF
jgi:hypothetical protein